MTSRYRRLISLLLYCCLLHLATPTTTTRKLQLSRIVGGEDADPTRYPYYTRLQIGAGGICGGTLIWNDIVLTAGHCRLPGRTITAFVNSTVDMSTLTGYEHVRSVADTRRHPSYLENVVTEEFDVLVIKLDSPIEEFDSINMPTLNTDNKIPADGDSMQVVGLGWTQNGGPLADTLQVATVNKISIEACNGDQSFNGSVIDNIHLCAGLAQGGVDACGGDSGGPLIVSSPDKSSDLLVGMVSFGEGCADPNFPGGYTRISAFAEWIDEQVCELSDSPPGSCPSRAPTNTPVTEAPVTEKPIFRAQMPTAEPEPSVSLTPSMAPVTDAPVTDAPTTRAPVFPPPVTVAPILTFAPSATPVTPSPSMAPVTAAPVDPPTSLSPVTVPPVVPTFMPFLPLPTSAPSVVPPPCNEECYCTPPNENATCPEPQDGIHNNATFHPDLIDIYSSWELTESIELIANGSDACFPFADSVGQQLFFPQSGRPQCDGPLPNATGVCAFVFEESLTNASQCPNRKYRMETFDTESDVPPDGVITHDGPCGVCSSAQDLAVRMRTNGNFYLNITTCQLQYLFEQRNFTLLQSCMADIGFTTPCGDLWSYFTATTSTACAQTCIGGIIPPFNEPLEQCGFSDCLDCISNKFGSDMERIAGRTMPNSGIVDSVVRNCSSFYPVVHTDPCRVVNSTNADDDDEAVPPSFGGFCFSGDATVQVQTKGIVAMKDLAIGDSILVDGDSASERFAPVYSFGHKSHDASAEYLQLHPSMLELSEDHMVFVHSRGAIPASMVRVGDQLNGDNRAVTRIEKVKRTGAFAPFTPSGTVVVNGVVASCYVSFQGSNVLKIGSIQTNISFQWLAHTFTLPRRLLFFLSGRRDEEEEYTEHGVAAWLDRPHTVASWVMNHRHPILMLLFIIPFLAAMLVLSVLEVVVTRPIICCMLPPLLIVLQRLVVVVNRK